MTSITKCQAVSQFRFADSYCAVWWKEVEFELGQGSPDAKDNASYGSRQYRSSVGIETHPTGRRRWNGNLAVSQFRLLLLYAMLPFDGVHALRRAVSELVRSSSCRARNDGPQCGSVTIRFDLQLAVQFVYSLAHPGQADARFRACFTKPIQTLRRYAAAVVSYFQNYLFKFG